MKHTSPASFAESRLRVHAHETPKRIVALLKKEQALIPYHELRSTNRSMHIKESKENAAPQAKNDDPSIIHQFQCQIALRIFLLAHCGATNYEQIMTMFDGEKSKKARRRRQRSNPQTKVNSTESFWVHNLTKLLSLAAITGLPPQTDLAEFVRETLDLVPQSQSTKLPPDWKDAILDYMEIRLSTKPKSPSPLKPVKTKKSISAKASTSSLKPLKRQLSSLSSLNRHNKILSTTSSLTSSRNHRMGSHFQKTLLHNMVARHPTQPNKKSTSLKPALKKKPVLVQPAAKGGATPTKKSTRLLFVVQETPEDDDKRPSKENNSKSHKHNSPIRRKRSRVLWETPPELAHKTGQRNSKKC